jgi:hypothetical protein
MDDIYTTAARANRSWRMILLVACFGLLAGLGLAGWGLSKSPQAQQWLFGTSATKRAPAISYTPSTVKPQPPIVTTPNEVATDVAVRMAQLEARVAKVESAAVGSRDSARAESLLIAFAARRALDRGMALGYIEGQLTQYFGQSQPRAVAMIIEAARQPATLDGLKAGLDEVAPKLSGASDDEGIWESIKRGFSSLIIVRNASAPSPQPVDRIARAQDMIAAGRVDQALAEIARLPNRAQAAGWMEAARRHIEAYRALDLLEAAAIMNVAEKEAPPAPIAAETSSPASEAGDTL